jgi:hypothetical protein
MPFYFFFGLLGLSIGALGVWFLLSNHPFESLETPGGPVDSAEAPYLVERMVAEGMPVDEATVVRVLELHGAYVDGIAEPEPAIERAGIEPEVPAQSS